jgi:hypothetical protein
VHPQVVGRAKLLSAHGTPSVPLLNRREEKNLNKIAPFVRTRFYTAMQSIIQKRERIPVMHNLYMLGFIIIPLRIEVIYILSKL